MAETGDKRGRAEAVRAAVDQAFAATAGGAQSAQGRAQELVDELAGAAGRVRDVIDDLRPPAGDEVRALRERIEALERRIETLESRAGDTQESTDAQARRP